MILYPVYLVPLVLFTSRSETRLHPIHIPMESYGGGFHGRIALEGSIAKQKGRRIQVFGSVWSCPFTSSSGFNTLLGGLIICINS